MIKVDTSFVMFLTVPSFELWRKKNAVLLDEESAAKKLKKVEKIETTIPSGLGEKIAHVRIIEKTYVLCPF
jgi:sorting nexin-8